VSVANIGFYARNHDVSAFFTLVAVLELYRLQTLIDETVDLQGFAFVVGKCCDDIEAARVDISVGSCRQN